MDLAARNAPDLEAWWMPFTANRQFKAAPRLLASASGMTYRTTDGQPVLDATSGLWCVNAGHGRPEIADAVHRQLMELDYAPGFQMGHPLAFDLATELAAIAPPGLDRIFFTNSGSESVDTALKIAIGYHRARGEAQRTRLIGREKGYHGVGFGGISVGGLVNNRRMFPLLPGIDHLPHTHQPLLNGFSKGQPEHGGDLAAELENIVQLHGGETIAAVIVEPVAGSAGVLPPPKGYLERLRALCDRHGILLIFDEVITGFGRVGAPFAAQRFGVTPDIMTTAKGITNGTVPMGAVFARRSIHDAFMQGPPEAIEFFHGYTYSGHPVACAAALATIALLEESLVENAARMGQHLRDRLRDWPERFPNVGQVRGLGLMIGIEMVRDRTTRERAPEIRDRVVNRAFERGLLVLGAGENSIRLCPPLVIARDHCDFAVDTLEECLQVC